ncbi:MAG: cytochrome c biogenesis heme-transporting ATPase CcmA [Gammaproteobacteria bacterium]|nr:cytochrome c biogenesis heme-transporting ATPase CcmA [Gammaproteobacteria bacterium]
MRAVQCIRGASLLFDNLNCDLQSGETLQIRGPNGSGKSTLLRILAGLAQPDTGAVLWCGNDVRELGPEFSAVLHYVGHHNGIKLDLTARENLAFCQELLGNVDAEALNSALERVGLTASAGNRARRLSAGQRRRLALARLILCHAPLWLLDEPLTSLDNEGRALFKELMQRHTAASGIVVLATHEADIGANGPQRELRLK